MEPLSSFQVCEKLGEGTFGKIYMIMNTQSGQKYAMKVEDPKKRRPRLKEEAYFYLKLAEDSTAPLHGIPKVFNTGEGRGYNYMIMDLLGPSLEDLFKKCNRVFSLKTVLMISVQLLKSIKFIHEKGILHRDIKPHNFVIGTGENASRIYIIDFGLSKKYIENGQHLQFKENKHLTGTVRYASISNQMGYEQSHRDDLETLAYNLIYFLKGVLPWQNTKGRSKQDKYTKILNNKHNTKIETLCENTPVVFANFLKYCRSLYFEQIPNYDEWIGKFNDEFAKTSLVFDFQYAWVQLPGSTTTSLTHTPVHSLHKARVEK